MTPSAQRTQNERIALLETMKFCPVCGGPLKKLHGAASSEIKTCDENHGMLSVTARRIDGVNFRVTFDKTVAG